MAKTICYIGDSWTDPLGHTRHWSYIVSDALGTATLNKGMGGQYTEQILARFQSDVVNNHPYGVVILAGGNDYLVANGDNAAAAASAVERIKQMVDMAKAANIIPVLLFYGRVKPTNGELEARMAYTPGFEEALRNYVTSAGLPFYSAWNDAGMFCESHPELYQQDGLHLSDAGDAYYANAMLATVKQGFGIADEEIEASKKKQSRLTMSKLRDLLQRLTLRLQTFWVRLKGQTCRRSSHPTT